jgi:twitching motility protein PilT
MPVDINELLTKAVKLNASDLHIKAGNNPTIRIDGTLTEMPDEPKLTPDDTREIAEFVLNESRWKEFEKTRDIDIAYSVPGFSRFRCNCYMQRGSVGIVFRAIPLNILEIEQLHLPEVLRKIAMEPRGLILVTGTTGSGKSTTLASMIDYINANRNDNIITVEDPIEYLHRDKKSIVSQREVGSDTDTFAKALRAALRQDPDVILVGEMRDFETIQTALTAADTGHLVMSTLHTADAVETINRIIAVFPPYQHKQVRMQLASILKAIVSMRLIPKADGTGRVPAVEILIATEMVKSCIENQDKTKLISDVIADGTSQYGMQTFDQSLLYLYKKELITYEDALSRATKPNDFALMVKGVQSTSDVYGEGGSMSGESDGPEIERFSR